MCCGGYLVSLQLSPDLHSPLAELWPGTPVGIPVPPPNIEGRFCTFAKRVVQALLSQRNLTVEGRNPRKMLKAVTLVML